MYNNIVLTVFPLLVVIAGTFDFFTYRIPNWINIVIAVSIIPFAILSGMPLEVFVWHVVAGLLAFVVGYLLFAFGVFGGGDAKMIAAAALWVGWDNLIPFGVITAFAGGALAFCMMIWSLIRNEPVVGNVSLLGRIFKKQLKLPYGIAIAAGALMVFPSTWWIQQFV